jgi:hypothetical protein
MSAVMSRASLQTDKLPNVMLYNALSFSSCCCCPPPPPHTHLPQHPHHHATGKTLKCADVGSDLRSQFADNYKTCTDKEVLQGGSSGSSSSSGAGGLSPSWAQMENMDVAGKDVASGGKTFTEVGRGECAWWA